MPQASESIEVDYILEHPPEQVWRLLTERELLEKWLMPNDIRTRGRPQIDFRTKPMGDWDGVVFCQVLESSPFTRFFYSWKEAPGENANYRTPTSIPSDVDTRPYIRRRNRAAPEPLGLQP